ncbi:uncharacterized protein SPPG_02677 [Spizellomyces punctatus DAOM BR117]|uniref:Uncharacterized protein n=1 Tax=Spizellomyces punctatus (strain DAOM BR117) TaxID=645134 RepID=A0A0L0HN02_SPIPD|nr:uncharacterized protein SPPG_02677 [Spizellomyces punctatus DAOM BR117]KND02189.1 hypothetical protein SPPG_02677 [Spizellomyces punctatus DAOM BR117]|eukprot:XP_016610228.1 hypothetical protein SPPG_02677 [Spizellomyces punctatus DAOM BR117]
MPPTTELDSQDAVEEAVPMQPIEKGTETVPRHFGDIMSSRETTLILPTDFSPMERILLTANGNVQRILSAYYNSTVSVDIIHNELINEESASNAETESVFRREVNLRCLNQICCNAKSTVTITDPEYLRLILEQQVGIGQLFRYLNILPEFELLQVGRTVNSFWREYDLRSNGVNCRIREEFPLGVFNLQGTETTASTSPVCIQTSEVN